MKRSFAIAAAVMMAFGSSAALADEEPSAEEAEKIKAAVAQWGCEGGKYEKESEGTGVFEAEDVKCPAGQYDFRLTQDFKVFAIIAD